MSYGKKLSTLMKARGVNTRKLSEITGIARNTLYHYRIDNRSPSLYNFDLICRALNIDYNYFME